MNLDLKAKQILHRSRQRKEDSAGKQLTKVFTISLGMVDFVPQIRYNVYDNGYLKGLML